MSEDGAAETARTWVDDDLTGADTLAVALKCRSARAA